MAQPFDPGTLTLSGTATPLTESVTNKPNYGPSVLFSTSNSGALAYQSDGNVQLIWVDRSGAFEETFGPPGEYLNFRLSPDQSRIAMDITRFGSDTSARDVATFDLKRGVMERLTTHKSADLVPVWSPDGKRIAFTSNRRGAFDPYATAAPNQEEILADMEPLSGWPTDWSPDGQFVLWQSDNTDLWIVPVSGGQQPFLYLNSPADERDGVFSPNGRWIAYSSNESGREEVYIQSFPATGGRRYAVSGAGGSGPAWRRDGRELFYVAGDGKLTAVPVILGETSIEFGPLQRLFSAPVGTLFGRNYEVSNDGRRFLIPRPAQAGGAAITVLLNWQSLLKR
jgi:Tol biopolymer transport system component